MALILTRTKYCLKIFQTRICGKGQDFRETFQKKIKPNKNLERLVKKIKEKYQKQKKASKKAINYMKKANYLQTDEDKTVDYNNDTKLDDLSTLGYNSDADINITKLMTIKPNTSTT